LPPVIGLDEVLANPREVASRISANGDIYGLINIEVRIAQRALVCLWLTLEPWAPMAAEGYPTETVAITMWAGGRIVSVPKDPDRRRWKHRNARMDLTYAARSRRQLFAGAPADVQRLALGLDWARSDPMRLGELCLWYPEDPRALRWEWTDGLISYMTIVHRHLQAEEHWRREGTWPAEDAPHGEGSHPIRTHEMRRAAGMKPAA